MRPLQVSSPLAGLGLSPLGTCAARESSSNASPAGRILNAFGADKYRHYRFFSFILHLVGVIWVNRDAPSPATIKAAVQVRPEILECHLVAGGFDYLIKTRVAGMPAYRELIGSVVRELPGVRETHTYAVMEEVKNTTALAL